MNTLHSESVDLEYDELATLQRLALEGAMDEQITISTRSLGEILNVSTQTVSRRLRCLETAGLVSRELVPEGQRVHVTQTGTDVLMQEYEQYRQIFESSSTLTFEGVVTDGMGEARHYITLDGYQRQFENRLGYEPYPGTMNVDLLETSGKRQQQSRLSSQSGIDIDSWETDERTYGGATCYPVTVETNSGATSNAHILAPDRTHHDEDQLELIAPVALRDEFGLADGDHVSIHVEE